MNLKSLLLLPPVALGVAGYLWLTAPQESPVDRQSAAPQTVRVLTVHAAPMSVMATGYGRVTPLRTWTAVSQVEGRAITVAANLEVGDVVAAGDVLVEVDQTDYALAVAKAEANIAAAEATLSELEGQEAASQRLLESEMRILAVAQAEFERIERLFQNGTASAATFDTQQKNLLNQENAVLSLQNTLSLYPAQRASAEATLAVRRAELAEAQRNLENTRIVAPFRGRVSQEAVEAGQFVRVGNELVALEGIAEAEVIGEFQPQAFAAVAQAALGPRFAGMSEVDATQITTFLTEAGVNAYVEIDIAQSSIRYPARLTRFRGSIDEATGTIGIVVRVEDPLVVNAQDRRPPLEFNSFVSVVLETEPRDAVISLPRAALRQDDSGAPYVYVADNQDALAIRPVVPGPISGDHVILRNGLESGTRVLLSTPRPSVEGMPLAIVDDGASR